MRNSTEIILLSFFSPENSPDGYGRRNYEILYDLFPEMTRGGLRSVINSLVKKKYLNRFLVDGNSVFELSFTGRQVAQSNYPILLNTERSKDKKQLSQVCIFLESPSSDPNFISLRRHLLKQGCIKLNRGVYLFVSQLAFQMLKPLLLREYSSSVLVCEINKFSLGYPEEILADRQSMKDAQNTLSGVITKMEELLKRIESKKDPSYRIKSSAIPLFSKIEFECARMTSQAFLPKGQALEIETVFRLWSQLITSLYFSRK